MRYQVMGGGYAPVYPADDLRSWRNECEQPAQTQRLGHVLEEWKAQYAGLRWIGFPRAGYPHVWYEEQAGFEVSRILSISTFNHHLRNPLTVFGVAQELQQIFQSHGWPHDFDREGCKKSLIEWGEKRTS